jgi:SAM-dependent methyltransferase
VLRVRAPGRAARARDRHRRAFIAFAQERLQREPELADVLEFCLVAAEGAELGEHFDVAISKDSFEHIAEPERYLEMLKRYVGPGGDIAIGFGPLWRSPYGAHQRAMTRVPWAHRDLSRARRHARAQPARLSPPTRARWTRLPAA